MKNRVLSLFLTLALALGLSVPALAAAAPVSEDEAAQVLAALDIMKGDENGNLLLDQTMTRAQLVKLTMSASPYRTSVGEAAAVSPYPDVPYTHWAASAVQTAVSAGYVTGYLDGTFRPDNTICLAEAVILALRLLGYQSTDFTGAYPSGQMALYRTLGLDKGVTASANGDPLSRRDAMYLFYNLLTAPTKAGQIYCTTLGYPLTPSGELDRVAIINAAMDGPVVLAAGWEAAVPFSLSTAKVYRGGRSAALGDLQPLDLLYYSKSMHTLWAYTDKVTGTIQRLQPSAAAPSAVVVAGQTLNIETASAAFALSDLGAYAPGDTVTVLLGRAGGVAAVVDGSSAENAATVCGMVTATGTGSYPDGKGGISTRKTVTLTTTAGTSATYPVDDWASLKPGELAQLYMKNGAMTVRRVTAATLTGRVSADGKTVGSRTLASGVEILDTYGKTGAMRVYPSRLAGTRLGDGDVRWYQTNSAGEITHLILNNVTGDLHRYGVVLQASEVSGSSPAGGLFVQSAYVYDLGGVPGAYQSSTTLFGVQKGPFQLTMDGNEVDKLKNLSEVKLTGLGSGFAQADNQSYALADGVLYYEVRDGDYYLTDAQHLNGGSYRLTGYYDKLPTDGGRIRVVVGK